jgi:monovalent cation:H+ antiporter-2, CPA2 family
VARAEGVEQTKTLYEDGVSMVVLPEMEAGLEIARQALLSLQIPATLIQEYTDAVRQELYAPLFSSRYDYRLITQLNSAKNLLEISWVQIEPDSPLNGQAIKDAAVRTRTGTTIVGIIRHGIFRPNPDPEHTFTAGDLVAIVGSPRERDLFKDMAQGAEPYHDRRGRASSPDRLWRKQAG